MGKELLMYKNHLQEYAEKCGCPPPTYQTVNEGFQHAPKFRSSILVNGSKYVSTENFVHKKEAEQDVAKLALDCIREKGEDDNGCPSVIHMELRYCKSIMHEFTTKKKLQVPKYRTIQTGCMRPVFVSSLMFDGKTCTGEVGKSKKPTDSATLIPIMKSKVRLYNAPLEHKDLGFEKMNVSFVEEQDPSAQKLVQGRPPPTNLNSCTRPINSNMRSKRKLKNSNWAAKRMRGQGESAYP